MCGAPPLPDEAKFQRVRFRKIIRSSSVGCFAGSSAFTAMMSGSSARPADRR
jgi:hypothetical protein